MRPVSVDVAEPRFESDGLLLEVTGQVANRVVSGGRTIDYRAADMPGQRAYDGLDRLTSETTPQGSISYAYDAANRRTSMTVAGQTAVDYSHDNANRLTQIAQGSSTVSFAYDNANRRTSLTLPNGVTMGYSYDNGSELTAINYTLGQNNLGNLTYAYDLAGRRTSMGGSLAAVNLPNAISTTAYNADNQLTQWGTATPTYDANGNTLSDGTNTYVWNARNQLASMNLTGESFAYDPFGRRASKTILSTTTNYLYDGPNPVQELSGTTPTANMLTGGVDEYFTRTDSTGTANFLTDALGSTVALTNSTGGTLASYTYEPFGNTTVSGSSTNSYQYTGRENDGTGVYFYRNRYYLPTLQRFIAEDPIGLRGGDVNLYAYVGNDPIDLLDPTGLTWQTNWNYFWDWTLGRGPRTRYYGPNDVETQELMNSIGVNQLRDAFYRNGCKSQRRLSYGTFEAYWDTVVNPFTADWSNTATEVGGFGGASITNNGNGTATYTIPNTSGTYSFFLHLVPDRSSPTGPMSNIYQTFKWTEPISGRNCGCQQ